MKVTAVIAEYNPLHNGHVRHIETARRETGADHVIAVMSGDYVQRGCPAIISKYERTRSALLAGADLVIELPVQYSCGSLEYFAMGAVSLIQQLGMADCISFGSECGDIELLKEASGYISFRSGHSAKEPDIRDPHDGDTKGRNMEHTSESKSSVLRSLEQGFNYSHAVNSDASVPPHIRSILSTPNNLLAAAYIEAARLLSFDCGFHTMKREGSAYHDASDGALSSSALRKELFKASAAGGLERIYSRMPEDVHKSLCDHLADHSVINEDDLSLLLFYRLQEFSEDPAGLTEFLDVSSSLAAKILAGYSHASSYSQLCMALKSKDMNYSRISRALLHILIGLKTLSVHEYINDGWHYYIRPLGFRRSFAAVMSELKRSSSLPVISKNADAERILNSFCYSDGSSLITNDGARLRSVRMFREGIRASDLYNKAVCIKSRQPFLSEYEHTMVIL